MKRKRIFIGIAVLIVSVFNNCTRQSDTSAVKDTYLGQEPPGMTLAVFAPGIVTTDKSESALTVSPDLREVYFIRKSPQEADNRIWTSRLEDGKLAISEPASFTYDCLEGYPCFTPDGKRLYYISRRPIPGQDTMDDWGQVWFVDKTEDGWSDPTWLDSPINECKPHFLSMEKNGTLYFGGSKSDVNGGKRAIFYAELKDSTYSEVKRLPDEINDLVGISHPAIAPDGSYIMVDSFSRENDRITGGVHISFKKPDGSWTRAESMKEAINVPESEIWCSVHATPDGKVIFFEKWTQETSKSDLYWIDAKIIERLRPDA